MEEAVAVQDIVAEWSVFRGFWALGIDLTMKLLISKSVVVMTLLSGAVGFVLSKVDYGTSDAFLAGKVRTLLRGRGLPTKLGRQGQRHHIC